MAFAVDITAGPLALSVTVRAWQLAVFWEGGGGGMMRVSSLGRMRK